MSEMPIKKISVADATELLRLVDSQTAAQVQAKIDAATASHSTVVELPTAWLKGHSVFELDALRLAHSGANLFKKGPATQAGAAQTPPQAPLPGARGTYWSGIRNQIDGQYNRIANHVAADVQTEQANFRERISAINSYKGPPTLLRSLTEWALDTPTKALAALESNETKAQLATMTDAQLAQFLSALDVNHLQKAKVPSADLLRATTTVLTAHLGPADKQAVTDWLAKAATATNEAGVGYPNLSPEGMGHVRAITTRMLNDGHILMSRFDGLDHVRYEHLQARRIQPGDVVGAQDYIRAVTGARPDPGTQAKLMDDPGFELDPTAQARRDPLLAQLRQWDKKHLDSPIVQHIADQLRGAPLDANGKPPRVGIKDADGKWYPFLDFNGPGATLQPLPQGILTRLPNAAYPNLFNDINVACEQAQQVQAAADQQKRPVADNERVPLWLHDFALQSDGTGWAMAAMLVKAKKAGVDVRIQYDPVGSANSNIEIAIKDGKVKHLKTDPAIYDYLRANGVPVVPFPIGKGSQADQTAKDWLSHLKKDLIGNTAYVGGAGNVGDEYSVKTMFHDAMSRMTGPGTATTADGLANYWNYSLQELTRREHRDHPELQGQAFDAFFSKKYGGAKPISDEYLAAYRSRVSQPVPGAQMDPYSSITQVDHWGGHQDENGKETLLTLAESAQHRFVVSMPYPSDKFFAEAAIKAEANMKKFQDDNHVPAAKREHATVIVPAFNDVSWEYWAMLDKYETMLKAGAVVCEFSGDPMLHNKFQIADDFWEHGSHNGDWRSRYGNNENIAFQHDKAGAEEFSARAADLKSQSLVLQGDAGLAIVHARKAKLEELLKNKVADALDTGVHL